MLKLSCKKHLFNIAFTIFNRKFHQNSKMCNLSTVFVRQYDNEETMKINFMYGNSEFPEQNYGFMRSKDERLEAAITRMKGKIQSSILQKLSKKKKLADLVDIPLPPVNIVLMKNGARVEENSKNIDAWTPDTEVIINDSPYKVIVNPPSVSQISLPKLIMSDFLVYPRVTLEFCSKDDCTFKWYRQIPKGSAKDLENDDSVIQVKNKYWKFIYEGFIYRTTESDVGSKLRVSCLPRLGDKSGMEESTLSDNAVVQGAKNCPFNDRHQYTKDLTGIGSYRFVSYNILADLYADTETARNELFPYCPVEFLRLDYRRQLYLKEIIGYNSDVLCLQEVDRKVFHDDLVPVLRSVGLNGVFNAKGGQVAEGLACFFRDTKFKLLESHSIILSEAIKTEPVLQKLHAKILENEKLAERFLNRTTALQVTYLESLDVPNKRILIGNLHLYFHPTSDNIRLLQGTCCILYMEHVLNEYMKKDPSYAISVVLSGDFNSSPDCGVYKLYTDGFLSSSCIDWNSNLEEKVEPMEFSQSLQLCSACGIPEYTNFTQGFVGCLDYIYFDRSLFKVTEVVPFPTHEQVTQHVALPNQLFPSDHIALVCTLSWK